MKKIGVSFLMLLLLVGCTVDRGSSNVEYGTVEPLFENSIVSTDIDFILDTDDDTFITLDYVGQEDKEMPDRRGEKLFDSNTYVFSAEFSDNNVIEIWCHSSFGSQVSALEYAEKVCRPLGKLPEVQREMIDHVVIHKGNETAFAETEGNFLVLYSENMDLRIQNHDLEETVFHESVHASIQAIYENSDEWSTDQKLDDNYITSYAESLMHLEDMPETAIFIYTYIKYPGRLSSDIEEWIEANIPNKLEFFLSVYE